MSNDRQQLDPFVTNHTMSSHQRMAMTGHPFTMSFDNSSIPENGASTEFFNSLDLNDQTTTQLSTSFGDTTTPGGDLRDENLAIFEIATLAAIFVTIIVGNGCVLIALRPPTRHQRLRRLNYFLVHLSVADLITGFFNVLPQLIWDITYRFYGNDPLCRTIKVLQLFGPYLSSYVLVMTSLDRYQVSFRIVVNLSGHDQFF